MLIHFIAAWYEKFKVYEIILVTYYVKNDALYLKISKPVPCEIKGCGEDAYVIGVYQASETMGDYYSFARCERCTRATLTLYTENDHK